MKLVLSRSSTVSVVVVACVWICRFMLFSHLLLMCHLLLLCHLLLMCHLLLLVPACTVTVVVVSIEIVVHNLPCCESFRPLQILTNLDDICSSYYDVNNI